MFIQKIIAAWYTGTSHYKAAMGRVNEVLNNCRFPAGCKKSRQGPNLLLPRRITFNDAKEYNPDKLFE